MWTDLGKQQLAAWGISIVQAEFYGLEEWADASLIYPEFERGEPCILIPYWWPNLTVQTFIRDGEELPFCRIRYLRDRSKLGFVKQKARKYDQPRGSGVHVYYTLGIEWPGILHDPNKAVIITEGEVKAIVGAINGLPVIALGGVFNFTLGGGEGLTPGLQLADWNGKRTYIAFDSDRDSNPGIRTAEARLVQELQTSRGARCFLVSIPSEGTAKVGMDDFLNKYGFAAFDTLLERAQALNVIDAKVIGLNRDVAWVTSEGAIFDFRERAFMQKADFVNGSHYSSICHFTQAGPKRTEPKQMFIAPIWLKHPHAARYGTALFRPGMGEIVHTDTGAPALNLWDGWRAEYGVKASDKRIAAFLELTEFLFRNMEPEDRDLPLKLLAYKMQNPMTKPALCLTLIGDEGCGKTLWCECVAAMVKPYSVFINSTTLGSEFNSYIERTLIGVINEASAKHIQMFSEQLKTLISDKEQPMRDLYRPPRMIESYTLYLMSANDRAVGSYSDGNRRMVVVDCPPPRINWPVYEYLGTERGTWVAENGPAALLGYLLEMDLKGWKPPAKAPMTAEKWDAYKEGLTPVQDLARQIKEADGENAIIQWFETARAWNKETLTGNNQALNRIAKSSHDGLRNFQLRPWYTPEELSMIFPHIVAITQNARYEKLSTPGLISRELRNAGVKYLRSIDNPKGFVWRGQLRQYLLVANVAQLQQGLTQEEFEGFMATFTTYDGRGQ